MKVKSGSGTWIYKMEYTFVHSNEEKISLQCVRRGLIELSTMSNGSTPSFSERCAGLMWQVERFAASGSPDFRRQYVEVLPLARAQPEAKPPPRPPRAVRSHQSFRWQDRLARNAGFGPPQLRVTVAGVPAFLAMNAPSEELTDTEAVLMQ